MNNIIEKKEYSVDMGDVDDCFCEFSSGVDTPAKSRKVIIAPRIKICKKPAVGVAVKKNTLFTGFICQECLDKLE